MPNDPPPDDEIVELNQSALDALRDLLDSDDETDVTLRSLIEEHIQNSCELLNTLHSSLESGALLDSTRAAHTLKSSAAMFGAMDASAIAAELEMACRKGDVPRMRELAVDLDRACRIAHRALANVR